MACKCYSCTGRGQSCSIIIVIIIMADWLDIGGNNTQKLLILLTIISNWNTLITQILWNVLFYVVMQIGLKPN